MSLIQYAKIYYFYRRAFMRTVRLLLLFFFLTLILFDVDRHISPKFLVFIFNLFIMFEVFFRFIISKYHPTKTVAENKGNIADSLTMSVLYAYLMQPKITGFLREILSYPQAEFILQKINVSEAELQLLTVPKNDIIQYASELVKSIDGSFVTTMDVIVSYLLYTEPQTKLLFTKQIKPEALMHILFWVRHDFPEEELPKKFRVHFTGEGFGESLVTGWTLETKKFTNDFTYYSLQKPPLLIGREKEYKEMLEALSKADNNNVLLVGDIGTGKETLVELLAYDSFTGQLGGNLNYKKVLELMVGPLIAGAADRSDLEVRLQSIIEEVAHSGNVIVYIPQFENIMGSSAFNLNISGALLPYLRDGQVALIATISPGNYKTYMEENPIKEVFEVIKIGEPDRDTAIQMLLEKTHEIEDKNQVILTYPAVVAAVEFANRYVQDGVLPGSAVTLLDEAANSILLSSKLFYGKTNKKIVLEDDVIQTIEQKTHAAIAAPKGEEKELLLHLEEKLHGRVISQEDAISAIAEAMRRLRSGLSNTKKPISFLFLGPTGVGKTETAKALADLYYGGENNIIRLDMSEYADTEGVKRLLGAAPGEGEERGELTDKIYEHPFSLVLLDEFEKANPSILDLFLQVLDDGRLTDNKGKTVSFVNSIIIATSNAGAEFIREQIKKGTAIDKVFQNKLLDYLQTNRIFKPELLNRFDDVITFKPLGQEDVTKIAQLMLKSVIKTMEEQDITLHFDDKILTKIAKEGYDPQFGARPLRRYLQDKIEDLLAQEKLRDEIKRGNTVNMTTDDSGKIIASVT